MEKEEEIEIIDDVEGSVENSNSIEPNTINENVSTENVTSEGDNIGDVVIDTPAEEPAPVESIAQETPSVENTFDVVMDSSAEEQVPVEPEVQAVPNVESTFDVVMDSPAEEPAPVESVAQETPNVESTFDVVMDSPAEEPAPVESVAQDAPNVESTFDVVMDSPAEEPAPVESVSQEEPSTESDTDIVMDSPVEEQTSVEPVSQEEPSAESDSDVVMDSPVEEPAQEEPVSQEETPSTDENFDVVMDAPTEVQENPEANEEINNNDNTSSIIPDNSIAPQEINESPVVENSTEETITEETQENPETVDNSTEASTEVQNINSDAINIKETTTLKNEAGTTVIGEINGESATTVSETMPESIDVNAKTSAIDTSNKKKVSIKTPKQKMTTIIIIAIIVLVVGVGGYFGYTFIVNNNVSFEAKNLSFEVGTPLPTSVQQYIETSSKVKYEEFSLDVSQVGNEIGEYTYTITRKGETKTGKITIQDTVGPVVTFKENLLFAKDTQITKDLLVSDCSDPSNCVYDLTDAIDSSVAGSQEVTISAKDDLGNVSNVVTDISIISKSLTCKGKETPAEDGTNTERLEDVFYFDDNDQLISSVGKKVTTFIDYGSYFALLNDEENKGKYNFDRKTFSYWVTNDVLYGNGTTIDDIKTYYSTNEYTCE